MHAVLVPSQGHFGFETLCTMGAVVLEGPRENGRSRHGAQHDAFSCSEKPKHKSCTYARWLGLRWHTTTTSGTEPEGAGGGGAGAGVRVGSGVEVWGVSWRGAGAVVRS